MAAGLWLVGACAGAADVVLPARALSKAATDTAAVEFVITDGRWKFSGRAVPLKDVARAIEAKVPVEIRIQDKSLEAIPIGIKFEAPDTRQGMRQVLGNFNFVEFDDPTTGRRVYLVSSLASDIHRVREPAKSPSATVSAAGGVAPKVEVQSVKSLDEVRKVTPGRIASRDQSQAEIERDFQRERDERLARAVDALSRSDLPAAVQAEALAELAKSGDPRATSALRAAMNQAAGLPGDVGPYVARAVWQHAVQLQFADPDANALVLSLGSSSNAGVRDVGRIARQEMERYRAAQNAPPR